MKFPIKLNKYTGSFLALGLILWDTKGMFFSGIPLGLIGITILFFYWVKKIFQGKNSAVPSSSDYTKELLFLISIQGLILLSGLFYETYDLLHADTLIRYSAVLHGIIIVFVIGLCYMLYQYRKQKNIHYLLIGLITTALLIQILSVFCSVVTGIDVTVMLQNACDYMVHLKNPYDARYADIFNGYYVKYYGTINYMTYWPTCVYVGSIFYYIFGDYRYAYIVVNGLLALALYTYRKPIGMSKTNALLVALLWVSNPVLTYNINRGWIDIFTTLPFFLFLSFLSDRKLLLSALFLGLTISVKLYYILLTPLICIYLLDQFGIKQTLRFIVLCAGVFFMTILPFLIINAAQFYQSTVAYYSVMKLARPDSLSWVSYLTRLNLELVSEGTYFSLGFIGLLCLWFLFNQKTITRLIEFCSMVLFIFFLCARQAFCNYYLFIFFLYFLGIYFSGNTGEPIEHDSGSSESINPKK